MKNIFPTALIAIIAALLGLGAGFILFNKESSADLHAGHDHGAEIPKLNESPAAAKNEIWTCSMHPQVRQPEPGECPICGMDLIPLSSSGDSDNPLVLQMTERAVKLANIQTQLVGSSNASGKTIQLNGKIKADERRSASQVTHIPGRIEQLYVSFTGDRIQKGQKLATIYSPPLITAQRELIEALKFQDINPKLVGAAKQKLAYWKIDAKTIAQIEESRQIIETIDLFAETSGVVMNKRVSVGDYLKEGQILFDLVNLNKLWVIFDAYEEDLAHVKVGDQIRFTTPAVNQEFSTRITFIDPLINAKTRVASLRGELNNTRDLLKPEMFVKGLISTRSNGSSTKIKVPKTAVMWTGQRSVVYLKVPDANVPSYEFREVEIGESIGNSYNINSGLEIDDEVVVNGAFVIDAAAQLNNQASMMNRLVEMKGSTAETLPDYKDTTDPDFKKQLAELVKIYIIMKDALVATDPAKTSTAAANFLSQLTKVDMKLVKGDAHLFWMEKLNGMKTHGEKIANSNDIEEQRKQFGFLSNQLIETITSFGVESNTLYVQHCPMAANDQGADWLSYESKIRNPYYGDQMLTCGMVKDSLLTK